jgi:hypothetical protein
MVKSRKKIPMTSLPGELSGRSRPSPGPRRRRQRLAAANRLLDRPDAGVDAAREVALAEARHHQLVDDALAGDVGELALQAVADFEPQGALVARDQEDDAVVDPLRPSFQVSATFSA